MRWAVMFLVGIFTAIVGVIVDLCVMNISQAKFSLISSMIEKCVSLVYIIT